jgi:DNA-directed RNA polymerase specialized sigma24 family protein
VEARNGQFPVLESGSDYLFYAAETLNKRSERRRRVMAERRTGGDVEPLNHVTRGGVKYRRAPDIEKQIADGIKLAPRELLGRAAVRDKSAAEFLKEESIVYFIRSYHLAGDFETVNGLAHALLTRCALRITRRFRALGLDQKGAEAAYTDLIGDVIAAVIDRSSDRGDFFQVRFWRAIRFRLLNVYDKHLRAVERDQTHDSLSSSEVEVDSEGSEEEVSLEERTSCGEDVAIAVEQRLAIQEGLSAIRDPRHREAFVLRHLEGWPLEADDPREPCLSRWFGVSVKTVYNWLESAEKDLDKWRDANRSKWDA